MENYYKASEVEDEPVYRIPTGIDEVDWLYGVTDKEGYLPSWGLPKKTISLWAGEKGTGKSRSAIELAKSVANRGFRVIYFQNEVHLSTLVGWIKQDGSDLSPNLYVSGAKYLAEQIKVMDELKVDLAIVDSITVMPEFETGSRKDVKWLIEGDEQQEGYADFCKRNNTHLILLSQLTKAGTAAGSNILGHLVDIEINITHPKLDHGLSELNGIFEMSVGEKHRYGRTGKEFWIAWEHLENKAVCCSENREYDKKWCDIQGIEDKLTRYRREKRREVLGNEAPPKKTSFFQRLRG
jgi:predicted ATP-dependent serine protease